MPGAGSDDTQDVRFSVSAGLQARAPAWSRRTSDSPHHSPGRWPGHPPAPAPAPEAEVEVEGADRRTFLGPGTFAVLSMSFLRFIMVPWPIIDGGIRRRRPASRIIALVGIRGALVIIGLTVWEALVEH